MPDEAAAKGCGFVKIEILGRPVKVAGWFVEVKIEVAERCRNGQVALHHRVGNGVDEHAFVRRKDGICRVGLGEKVEVMPFARNGEVVVERAWRLSEELRPKIKCFLDDGAGVFDR